MVDPAGVYLPAFSSTLASAVSNSEASTSSAAASAPTSLTTSRPASATEALRKASAARSAGSTEAVFTTTAPASRRFMSSRFATIADSRAVSVSASVNSSSRVLASCVRPNFLRLWSVNRTVESGVLRSWLTAASRMVR